MSGHEKKQRSLRLHGKVPSSSTTGNSSSSIATPPRAALRSKIDHQLQHAAVRDDNTNSNASSTSTPAATIAIARQTPSHEETQQSPKTNQFPSSNHTPNPNATNIRTRTPPSSTSSSSASTTFKDAKIASLEIDLANMEDEFSRELSHLSHKLTTESETANFWQQKHSTLNQTFLKTDTDLRLLRQEVSAFQQAREERERDVKTRISSLMLDRDAFREAWNEAVEEGRGREEEVRLLRGQVRGLKSWVSSSSKMDEQVADEAFGEKMQRLGNGLQNWVITNFRRVKIASTEMRAELSELIPSYETIATSSKIHLVQSLVSRLLVEHIFQAYFVGLSQKQASELESVENYLASFGTVESMNQWRSTTLAILRKDAPQKLEVETTGIVETLVERINTLMGSISDIQPSDPRDQSLRTLINSSIELSRLLRVQKAIFSVLMPRIVSHQRTMFDADSMEDIGGEDEDTLNEREIWCITFPGIVKSGDENGEKNHLRNVVAKIRVLCAPD